MQHLGFPWWKETLGAQFHYAGPTGQRPAELARGREDGTTSGVRTVVSNISPILLRFLRLSSLFILIDHSKRSEVLFDF